MLIITTGYVSDSKFRPVIEMTIPSSLDPTVAPAGGHVVQLFTQYTPYTLADGQEWTEEEKKEYADVGKGCSTYRSLGMQQMNMEGG